MFWTDVLTYIETNLQRRTKKLVLFSFVLFKLIAMQCNKYSRNTAKKLVKAKLPCDLSTVAGHIASSQIASMEAMCLEVIWQYTHTCILPPLKIIKKYIWVIGKYLTLIYFTWKFGKLHLLLKTLNNNKLWIFFTFASLSSLTLIYSHWYKGASNTI